MKPHQSSAGYYSTKELAQMFHADESTIKRWADRNMLRCFRTPGGHRKFTSQHILEFIRTYNYELKSQRDAAAKDVLPSGNSAENTPVSSAHVARELFLALALKGDVKNLVDVLESAHVAHMPLEEIYENVVGETIRALHAKHVAAQLSAAEMYSAASLIMESLLQFRLLTPRNLPNGKTAICSTLTNGLQDIALVCACHLLETKGWKVYYLGSNVSVDALESAVVKYAPEMVCLPVEYLLDGSETKHISSLVLGHSLDYLVLDYFIEADKNALAPYASLPISVVPDVLTFFSHIIEHAAISRTIQKSSFVIGH